jgi:S-DNA-T family DNA segregation ATPase FtsK/SpoIIIE
MDVIGALGSGGMLVLVVLASVLLLKNDKVRKAAKVRAREIARRLWTAYRRWHKRVGYRAAAPGDGCAALSAGVFVSGFPVLSAGGILLAAALWTRATRKNGKARGPVKTLKPTREEKRLMGALSRWESIAPARGLELVTVTGTELTKAGIVADLDLGRGWSVPELNKRTEDVGALLAALDDMPMEIGPGGRKGKAKLALRTRSATDGIDMGWTPDCTGLGLDTVTGEEVVLGWRDRVLVAGTSGAGKSVFLRPLLADVLALDWAHVVYIDMKMVEGALWEPLGATVAYTTEDVEAVVTGLVAEMNYRLADIKGKSAKWTPTPAHPETLVIVDEGAEVMLRTKLGLAGLETLARMARAAGIHLWWCTQKPTMSGPGAGIPPQIAAQMNVQVCLKVRTPSEARTVLGEDATALGWHANLLPAPGHALIRGTGRGPVAVKGWHMEDGQIQSVPSVHKDCPPVLSASADSPVSVSGVPDDLSAWLVRPRDTVSLDKKDLDWEPLSVADCVLSVLWTSDGPLGVRDIARECGKNPGTVSRTLRQLQDSGKTVLDEAGKWSAPRVDA